MPPGAICNHPFAGSPQLGLLSSSCVLCCGRIPQLNTHTAPSLCERTQPIAFEQVCEFHQNLIAMQQGPMEVVRRICIFNCDSTESSKMPLQFLSNGPQKDGNNCQTSKSDGHMFLPSQRFHTECAVSTCPGPYSVAFVFVMQKHVGLLFPRAWAHHKGVFTLSMMSSP